MSSWPADFLLMKVEPSPFCLRFWDLALLGFFLHVFSILFRTPFRRKWGWRKKSKYVRVKSGVTKKGWRKGGWWKIMKNSGGWRKRVWREILKFFGRGEKKVGGKKNIGITNYILRCTTVKNYPILDRYFIRNYAFFFTGMYSFSRV